MGVFLWKSYILDFWIIISAAFTTAENFDDMSKLYRGDESNAGVRCDAIIGKEIAMKWDTHI